MASVDLEYNQGFKIYNANGTRFNNLVLHKATYETVVMSLGDKISGIVYYKNNKLVVNMTEYIMYKNVKYVLVNPPTVIKEGLVSDNGELKGMTKYSFTFYHPMYMLSNFPFSDIAVSTDQQRYLSQNKTFSWIGNLTDYVAKLNKNLEGTQWKVSIGTNVTDAEKNKLSEVLSFDNNTIADALKTAYETWEIPYIIDQTYEGSKRFLVRFGLPNNEIYEKDKNGNFVLDDNNQKIPFVFKYGQGVGLKNNSRTPKNNKIVTRIAGYGSEDNIPYGYPQIVWTGNQSWNYTINNDSTATNSYPIYDGIVGGQKVRLIKHPFTRTHLMPPIYSETVNKKVNPNATGYNPNIELVDYYDANDNTYPNQIKAGEPSYEIHEFEDIKPEFGSFSINSATPYDGHSDESITQNKFLSIVDDLYTETDVKAEKTQLNALRTSFVTQQQYSAKGTSGNYEYDWSFKTDGLYKKVKYASSGANFEYVVNVGLTPATINWDDTMDEQGNYVQSYFKVTIPALGFDLYASAAITQEMTINMRSGACIGCSFPVMVDWDDYKRNFYDKDGNFAPTGTQRNYTKYPNSTNASITLILQKETNTFGTLMPNIYQKPASGDKFVILGISLPTSYITTAEGKLETEMKKYMRDNNVYYYEYPLKFDEHFLISNEHILSQMKPNVIVNFEYADVEQSLYIKQMSIKYNESPLPKYDITLTDDVDVVLNKIGEAIAEYRGQRQYENGGGNSETLDGNKFLRKDINDTASGTIRMLKGLQVGERFVTGLLGEGGIFRKDDDGTTYLECDRMYVRMKAYFDTVEVRRFLHSGGNRIASAAGIKCSRVEYIASNGLATQNVSNAVKFRCYFRAQDNGVSITNDFEIGDQAYCKETNANLGQHGYWRLVVGKTNNPINGELWIDLSASDCLSGSDIPIAQDDIIQLGHRTDKKRQGAIIEYVSGEDAPSYQIYQGINTYSLDNKNYIGLGYSSETNRAYMNVYGDMFVGVKPDAITGKSPTYIKYVQDDGTEQHNPKLIIKGVVEMLSPDDPEETTTLDDFAKAITGDIEYLQQQIDGEIDTWFYDGEPALNKYPASEWTTDTEKKEHLGDLYYDKLNGNAYRFIYDKDNETYSWLLLSDSAILEALRIANEAKDTADNKRRVFLTDAQHPHPTPPYDEGDLWVNAVWPYQGQNIGSTYNDEILKCIKPVPREEGGSDVTVFSIGDWSAANGYKTALSDFINNTYASFVTNIQTQVDRKAQTWYLSFDPSYSWAGNEKQHVGDLWYCTDDIENTDYKKNTTWIYQEGIDPNTGKTIYYWAEAAVPDEVFDMIDGKSAIYTEWGAWIDESGASSLQVRDLLIPAADIVRGNVTYKQNKVYRCTNRNTQNPVFEEIAYTDDSAFNGYINAILNGTGSSGNAAAVAAAQKAIKDALGGGTTVDGGLLLTSLIAMRKYNGSGSKTDIANYTTWAGISGVRKDTETGSGWKGYGIASWYGGAMVDHEVSTTATDHAKSLFRFDGSGYLAGGNITWDKNGIVTIANVYANIGGTNTLLTGTLQTLTNLSNALPLSLQSGVTYLDPKYSFTNLSVLGKEVATKEFVSNNYVPLAFFNALFAAFSTASPTSSTTPINPSTWTASTVINNLKIKVGTWTEQYLSALGNNPSSGGQDTFNADLMWQELGTNSTAKLIPQSHLDLSGYALKDDVTKTLTIKQDGQNDVVYNGTEAKTITISGGVGDRLRQYTLADGASLSTFTHTTDFIYTAKGGENGCTDKPEGVDAFGLLSFKTAYGYYGQILMPAGGGRLFVRSSNALEGVAWDGVALLSDLSSYAKNSDLTAYTKTSEFKTLTVKGGATQVASYSPTNESEFSIKAGSGITVTGAANEVTIARNQLQADDIPNLSWEKITSGKPTTLAGYGIATKWWGQTYKTVGGKEVVEGDMTGVGNITMSGNVMMERGNGIGFKIGTSKDVNAYVRALRCFVGSEALSLGYETTAGEDGGTVGANGRGFETRIYGQSILLYCNTTNGIAEVMRLDNAGNVGIGTVTPQSKLDVNGTTNATEFRVGNNYITTHDTTDKHLKIVTAKEEIRIGTRNSNNTLHINYGGVGAGETLVTDYQWHAGTSTSWASFRMGDTQVTRLYLFKPNSDDTGAVYLTYESSGAGKGVHLVGDGFWADGFVSALGSQSSGGQDYFDESKMWDVLGTSTGTYANSKIHTNHLPSLPSLIVNGTTYPLSYDGSTSITIESSGGKVLLPFYDNPTNINTSKDDFGDGGLRTFMAWSGTTTGRPNADAHIIHSAWHNKNGWDVQIAVTNGAGAMLVRGQISGTWGEWKELAFKGDLGSYATKSELNGYVTLAGEQEITGQKTFTSQMRLNGSFMQMLSINSSSSSGTTAIEFTHTLNGTQTRYGSIGFSSVGGSLQRLSSDYTAYTILDSGNSSVSKSGDTLTVTINGTTQSLTNSWRGIQNNLTSTSTTDSLSANQGKTLYGYITTLQGYFTNGVANSAAKLTTTNKTLWGNEYWTSGGVPTSVGYDSSHTANLNYVNAINMAGNLDMVRGSQIRFKIGDDYIDSFRPFVGSNVLSVGYGTTTVKSFDTYIYGYGVRLLYGAGNFGITLRESGNVGIGTTEPACKLHVSGVGCITGGLVVGAYTQQNHKLYVAGSGQFTNSVYVKNSLTINKEGDDNSGAFIKIGDATLTWDGSALKCDKDFYSTGAVSALGSNASGGGSGISDISVSASLSGTRLTINVSGQTGSVDLSSISGTSGDYIPLSGGNVVTGNLNPATGYNNLDLGNSTNKWRQLYLSEFASVSGLVSTKICIDCNAGGYNQYGGVDYIGEINNFDGKLCLQYSSNYAVTIGDSSALNANDKLYVNGQTRINGNLILDDYTYNNTNGYKLYADGNVNITGTLGTNGFTANMGNMNFLAIAGNINTAYKLYIGGDGNSKSIYAEGSIYTHGSEVDYSDIRLKNIVEYVNDLTVDKVAKAPLFKYYWRDRVNDRLRIGTSAQYWQEVLPQAVEICSDGYLGISYAITALASSVSVARKVVDHELRIKQLEQENAILRKEIEELKAA